MIKHTNFSKDLNEATTSFNASENKIALITGTSSGIGEATAKLFLAMGFTVHGIDLLDTTIHDPKYHHYKMDILDTEHLPEIPELGYLINNAGVQDSYDDIAINLKATIDLTEKLAFQPSIKAVVNVSSTSAHTGAEFPYYASSKGGLLTYTKNLADRLSVYGATANSVSPGGVITTLNQPVMSDKAKWSEIMKLTPLKKWATAAEIAQWIYFIAVMQNSMTGQDVVIDNGEMIKSNFVW